MSWNLLVKQISVYEYLVSQIGQNVKAPMSYPHWSHSVTCHLHDSAPQESILMATKSSGPYLRPSQFPAELPAKTTEPSSPIAAPVKYSVRLVPSCDYQQRNDREHILVEQRQVIGPWIVPCQRGKLKHALSDKISMFHWTLSYIQHTMRSTRPVRTGIAQTVLKHRYVSSNMKTDTACAIDTV